MALNYDIDEKLKQLSVVLDEYAEWYSRVMRHMIYPDHYDDAVQIVVSDGYELWVQDVLEEGLINNVTLDRVQRLHDDLHQIADSLVALSLKGQRPEVARFDGFVDMYDGFITTLRRLERDSLLSDSGLDMVSGLRSAKALTKDLEREMERRSRRGKPFCIVLARIDNYELIRSMVDDRRLEQMIAAIGRVIRKCVRSFDDAYRLNEAEFVMSLKHSDINGAAKTVLRLRNFLEEESISIKNEDVSFFLTMSTCITEPLPGDPVQDMIQNMREDLNQYKSSSGAALEYSERSAVERFVKDIEG